MIFVPSTPYVLNAIGRLLVRFYKGQFLKEQTYKGFVSRIYWVDKMIPKTAVGQTFGDYVFIRSDLKNDTVRFRRTQAHELVHVDQGHRLGWFGMVNIVLYCYQYIKYGYKNMPLENEAREGELPLQ